MRHPRGVNEARQAYVAAGATERLRALADGAVGRGWFDTALRSFIAANANDRDGAERVGDAILHKAIPTDDLYIQQLHLVLRAYRYAGARRKLVELGRKFVAVSATEDALSAFRSAARFEEQ